MSNEIFIAIAIAAGLALVVVPPFLLTMDGDGDDFFKCDDDQILRGD